MIERDHRLEADVRLRPAGHQAERVAAVQRAGRQQPLRLQLLAAEPDHHGGAAEIRIEADVAQGADRHGGAGRVDRDAAAVGVLEPDHVVDIREARQQLGLDAPHRELDHAGDALHRRGDAEDVARADRAVRRCGSPRRCSRRAAASGSRARVAIGRSSRAGASGISQQPLVDPASGRNVAQRACRSRRCSAAPDRPRARSVSATLCPCGTCSRSVSPDGSTVPAGSPPSFATIATLSRSCMRMVRA